MHSKSPEFWGQLTVFGSKSYANEAELREVLLFFCNRELKILTLGHFKIHMLWHAAAGAKLLRCWTPTL